MLLVAATVSRLDAGTLLAAADEGVVREIVTVLIDNAFRHGAGAVTVSVRRRDPWLRVEVRDEGSGFGGDPESAFERSVTRDGHGIGLALARSLAHAEGGRLSILIAGECPVVGLALRAAPTIPSESFQSSGRSRDREQPERER